MSGTGALREHRLARVRLLLHGFRIVAAGQDTIAFVAGPSAPNGGVRLCMGLLLCLIAVGAAWGWRRASRGWLRTECAMGFTILVLHELLEDRPGGALGVNGAVDGFLMGTAGLVALDFGVPLAARLAAVHAAAVATGALLRDGLVHLIVLPVQRVTWTAVTVWLVAIATRHLHRGVEVERRRAAQAETAATQTRLHDTIMQTLTFAVTDGLHGSIPWEVVRRNAQAEARQLGEALGEPRPDETVDSLPAAARRMVVDLALPPSTLVVRSVPAEIPPQVAHRCAAAMAEALRNGLKHAGPTGLRLIVEGADGVLAVTVEDRGPGMHDAGTGPGITGMREAMADIGGSVTFAPRDGGGTIVRLTWQATGTAPVLTAGAGVRTIDNLLGTVLAWRVVAGAAVAVVGGGIAWSRDDAWVFPYFVAAVVVAVALWVLTTRLLRRSDKKAALWVDVGASAIAIAVLGWAMPPDLALQQWHDPHMSLGTGSVMVASALAGWVGSVVSITAMTLAALAGPVAAGLPAGALLAPMKGFHLLFFLTAAGIARAAVHVVNRSLYLERAAAGAETRSGVLTEVSQRILPTLRAIGESQALTDELRREAASASVFLRTVIDPSAPAARSHLARALTELALMHAGASSRVVRDLGLTAEPTADVRVALCDTVAAVLDANEPGRPCTITLAGDQAGVEVTIILRGTPLTDLSSIARGLDAVGGTATGTARAELTRIQLRAPAGTPGHGAGEKELHLATDA